MVVALSALPQEKVVVQAIAQGAHYFRACFDSGMEQRAFPPGLQHFSIFPCRSVFLDLPKDYTRPKNACSCLEVRFISC